jgi:hypothetical protein
LLPTYRTPAGHPDLDFIWAICSDQDLGVWASLLASSGRLLGLCFWRRACALRQSLQMGGYDVGGEIADRSVQPLHGESPGRELWFSKEKSIQTTKTKSAGGERAYKSRVPQTTPTEETRHTAYGTCSLVGSRPRRWTRNQNACVRCAWRGATRHDARQGRRTRRPAGDARVTRARSTRCRVEQVKSSRSTRCAARAACLRSAPRARASQHEREL